MCHVHHDTVGKVAISLAESAGENYERPTRRRYIDKHGNLSWMETVTKVAESLGKIPSYSRPTKRKYYNKLNT